METKETQSHSVDVALTGADWWRTAAVYQVYIRSFADGDGDGEGDIAGLVERLPYITRLGVDAIWVNPWYASPFADGGYDITDYRRIDARFGDLHLAERFVREAHECGLRVIIDLVPNHTSDEHEWFRAAIAGDPAARRRYIFREGKGETGELPPNDWQSAFGGSAWQRESPDAGEWYLHLYSVEQPDLNWDNPEVRAEFEEILRFWFDRGVDGIRIDVAHGLVKAEGLPDAGVFDAAQQYTRPHPAWNQPGIHEIYRAWRRIAAEYDPTRIFVAEAWVPTPADLAAYLRPDELHLAFQMDMCFTAWNRDQYLRTISDSLATASAVGAPTTWVLANHDVPRTVTRYGRSQPDGPIRPDWDRRRWGNEAVDLVLGQRRARAAALITMALPGSLYVYQGEELGLPEFEEIDPGLRQDPTWWQSEFTEPGRDGCRVPLPWRRAGASYGFNESGLTWLPQPAQWGDHSVEAQDLEADSMLALYRAGLAFRRTTAAIQPDPIEWLSSVANVLAFARGEFECWTNFGDEPIELPAGCRVLLASEDVVDGMLPGCAAAYIAPVRGAA